MFENRTYFFDNGIRFECRRCGECCTGDPGTVYIGPEEILPIAEALGVTKTAFISQYLYPYKDSFSVGEDKQGRCLLFNDGCKVYEVRPLQCRTFPFWFDNMRSESRWAQVVQSCPGIGQGRCYTKEEIILLAGKTTMI